MEMIKDQPIELSIDELDMVAGGGGGGGGGCNPCAPPPCAPPPCGGGLSLDVSLSLCVALSI
jgi:hypothetical protein